MSEQISRAEFLRSEGRTEEALRVCNEVLNEHFDDPKAIFLIARIMLDSGKSGLAHALFSRFIELKPNVGAAWNNLGSCYHEAQKLDQAERCFKRATKINPEDASSLSNLGLVYLFKCQPELAIDCSRRALALHQDLRNARHNLGLALLMRREWKEGWENYEASVGCNSDRRERVYGEEKRWDGTKGQCVVAYGEQGLGDEISFASCLPEFIKDGVDPVIECDARLAGLFSRSFPGASVYGTRYKEMIDWADRHSPQARVAFGSLPKYYRNADADFPGKPYLVADPERRLQWRALLDSLGPKPKVGIAWQGGLRKTGKAHRSVQLEDLLPVLRQDATFISLQYRNAQDVESVKEKHGIHVHHWPRAVECADYDETAALVAELDMVISVTTAVIHLAGGLGVPCMVLTPKNPMWRYGIDGEKMLWYDSVTLIRQNKLGQWIDPISEAAYRLREWMRGKKGNGSGHLQLHRAEAGHPG